MENRKFQFKKDKLASNDIIAILTRVEIHNLTPQNLNAHPI